MNETAIALIREAAAGSGEGRLHFGRVVEMMVHAGVEAYAADYRCGRTTYYLADGDSLTLPLEMPQVPIAQAFDTAALQAAIRGSQRGEVRYPEFKRLSRQAGCVGYTVWIAGRHVAYFGRKGESHVERFPD
jgi:uncharacterized protein YbcV (DUF1398 family)